jgi:Glycosyl hydrolase family 3 N terminal domain
MDESVRGGQQAREDLLLELSLEDKISLLTGADYWSLHGHPGIGLRPIRTSDGPAGVRGPRWDERDTALNVPAPVALAATWDPRRAELIGGLLAAECRRKEVDVLLAPTVNLQRSPLGGRTLTGAERTEQHDAGVADQDTGGAELLADAVGGGNDASARYALSVLSKSDGSAWCKISRSIWSTPSLPALLSKACSVSSDP